MSRDQRDKELLLNAVKAIASAYGLSATELSEITGIEAGHIERLDLNEPSESLAAEQTQAAQQLLGLHKELSAFFGQDHSAASRWLRVENLDFDTRPIDLIKTPDGIERVRLYLSDYRSRS